MDSKAVVRVRGKSGVRRSESQWRALLGAFARSGERRRVFCTRHGVALSTFDWWRRRLGVIDEPDRSQRSDAGVFVELARAAAPPLPVATPAWDMELDLGAGVVLRLRRGVAC